MKKLVKEPLHSALHRKVLALSRRKGGGSDAAQKKAVRTDGEMHAVLQDDIMKTAALKLYLAYTR